MNRRRLLTIAAIFLALASVIVAVFLKRIPLPLRLETGFLDLLAATAIAVFLIQTRKRKP